MKYEINAHPAAKRNEICYSFDDLSTFDDLSKQGLTAVHMSIPHMCHTDRIILLYESDARKAISAVAKDYETAAVIDLPSARALAMEEHVRIGVLRGGAVYKVVVGRSRW